MEAVKEKSWIPEISDEELEKRCKKIRPLVRNKKGILRYIAKCPYRDWAFMWSPKFRTKAPDLNVITDITTYHTWAFYGFFKPTIAEVIAQIPIDVLDRVVAFEIIKSPETTEDLNRESVALNAGYHVAITRLYEKQVQNES